MSTKPREVLTPLAACVLFGKSGEAVRRATAEGLVTSPCTLQFSERSIRLIDLESAIAYWMQNARPAYMEPLEAALADMRWKGITFHGQIIVDGTVADDALCYFRVLHPMPLVNRSELTEMWTERPNND